jgi:acetolactate decarboxylase
MSHRLLPALLLTLGLALPAQAEEAYQLSALSSLLAGAYDGISTVEEVLGHGDFGLGTFDRLDGEMVVLDGRVFRSIPGGPSNPVSGATLTPFAVVTAFHPQQVLDIPAGQSYAQLQATLDALPFSPSRILAVRVDGHFRSMHVRSEPPQTPPYRPLAEVLKEQQVVVAFDDTDGSLIGFRFPPTASSINVPGWHFHFISSDRKRGGHVFELTTGATRASVEEISELRILFPARAPAGAISDAASINAAEKLR